MPNIAPIQRPVSKEQNHFLRINERSPPYIPQIFNLIKSGKIVHLISIKAWPLEVCSSLHVHV